MWWNFLKKEVNKLEYIFSNSRYDVLNYVGNEKGFRMVGEYRKKRLDKYRLKIMASDIMFYDKTNQIPESVCSKPCRIGQRVSATKQFSYNENVCNMKMFKFWTFCI